MDHIDEHLTTDALNPRYNRAIHASLGIARKTLNRYYTLTDMSEVYRIAMGMLAPPLFCLYSDSGFFFFSARIAPHVVLHPRHKLAYFKSANWEDKWMDTALEIV